MWTNRSRALLLQALFLDWLGLGLGLMLMLRIRTGMGIVAADDSLQVQGPWMAFLWMLYPLLGWLFGSYTVLHWRRMPLPVLIQRVLITAAATWLAVAVTRSLINPSPMVWFVLPQVQLLGLVLLSGWAVLVRLALRRQPLLVDAPKLLLLAQQEEIEAVLHAWERVPQRQSLVPIDAMGLLECVTRNDQSLQVAVSSLIRRDPSIAELLHDLLKYDPRRVKCLSLLRLFEQYQERLPPQLIGDDTLIFDELPWLAPFSVEAQLKRFFDLLVAALLLVVTAPLILVAALLICIEDRGPIFYSQQRSGWLGHPFTLHKLRTMSVQPLNTPAKWTKPGDHRVTTVGLYLRRLRIDELPQLWNVLIGEMSLIGPRPERPELELQLEKRIPHYRRRHSMRPGLSGLAQVSMPYAGSIEESDLKLSYDLYYLRHFSTWLDCLILLRTIKTVLKAGGL